MKFKDVHPVYGKSSKQHSDIGYFSFVCRWFAPIYPYRLVSVHILGFLCSSDVKRSTSGHGTSTEFYVNPVNVGLLLIVLNVSRMVTISLLLPVAEYWNHFDLIYKITSDYGNTTLRNLM
jgi:hypothetical protein